MPPLAAAQKIVLQHDNIREKILSLLHERQTMCLLLHRVCSYCTSHSVESILAANSAVPTTVPPVTNLHQHAPPTVPPTLDTTRFVRNPPDLTHK